jgi:hypothetical protein
MALRNELVTGTPSVFPSHGGAIPFFIGNNPNANGRWNTAGGLITGEVVREREQLAKHFQISASSPAELDRRVSEALLQKTWRYICDQPLDWLALEAKKFWFTLGNHRFIRDYDVRGEAEILGAWHQLGLPFGVLLGLGILGLFAVRARRPDRSALVLVVAGQFFAVLAANVLVFTSAQNREPLSVPLSFLAGPGLVALWQWVRKREDAPPRPVLLASAVLALQAFWPRLPNAPDRPSSFHYYNLASVEEKLGRPEDSLRHYARAVEINPREPLFRAAYTRLLRAQPRRQANVTAEP